MIDICTRYISRYCIKGINKHIDDLFRMSPYCFGWKDCIGIL